MKRAMLFAACVMLACKREPAAVTVAPTPSAAREPLFAKVDVHADGKTMFNQVEVRDDADLTARAKAATTKVPGFPATISADGAVRYGRVLEVMDALRAGGITEMTFGMPLDLKK